MRSRQTGALPTRSGSTAKAAGTSSHEGGPDAPLERVSTRRTAGEYAIFDEVTGKCVGTVNIERAHRLGQQRYPTSVIRVFDSKSISNFNTHLECVAFVKGVEALLSYMLEAKDVKGLKSVLNNMLEAKEFEIPA
jgi:hypothetical protein